MGKRGGHVSPLIVNAILLKYKEIKAKDGLKYNLLLIESYQNNFGIL